MAMNSFGNRNFMRPMGKAQQALVMMGPGLFFLGGWGELFVCLFFHPSSISPPAITLGKKW
jgi:hypothetical protein